MQTSFEQPSGPPVNGIESPLEVLADELGAFAAKIERDARTGR
jgi:hypothetical protein